MTLPPFQHQPARRPPPNPFAGVAPPLPGLATAPPGPPLPPRILTPDVLRRSWREPIVRFWWLASAVLLLIAVWFVLQQIFDFHNEQRLIAHGVLVSATITDVDGDSRVGARFPPGHVCGLKFQVKGQTINLSGTLSGDDYITNGQTVALRVDASDPSYWTDRTQAEPVVRRMIAGAVILLTVLATSVTFLRMRRRVLRVWRDGPAVAYSVVDTRHTALAPLCHAVRCVAVTGRDQSLVTVYLPPHSPQPSAGEILWLLHPPGKPRASIAAVAFQ